MHLLRLLPLRTKYYDFCTDYKAAFKKGKGCLVSQSIIPFILFFSILYVIHVSLFIRHSDPI